RSSHVRVASGSLFSLGWGWAVNPAGNRKLVPARHLWSAGLASDLLGRAQPNVLVRRNEDSVNWVGLDQTPVFPLFRRLSAGQRAMALRSSSATGAPMSNTMTPAATKDAPLVRLSSISKRYGALEAVKPLDLEIRRGDFLAILGPSGCGKTTLLRIIGGFVAPTTGTVSIDGQDVTAWGPEKRPTNTVFQGYGLFPHMTVRQNIAYGLRTAKRPQDEIR